MQIVIDIPEEDYQNLKTKDKFNDMFLNYYEKLIVHGIHLPKGHGRLIDADNIPIDCDYYDVDNAPTIIEADKAESEVEG